jgi:hypothetical protein
MRDGPAPRSFAAASIKTPGLPGGTEERFAGYGVMRLPFRSGHYLALRHFPASSIGPGLQGRVAPRPTPEVDVLRGRAGRGQLRTVLRGHRSWRCRARADRRHLGRSRSLRVTVADVLTWEVHQAATAATRLLSSASRLLPDRSWDSDRVLGAMGRVAGLLLRAGRVRLQGTVPQRPALPGRPTAGLGGHQQHRAGWRSRHRSAGALPTSMRR